MKPQTSEVTPEQAEELLRQKAQERVNACGVAIQAVLEKHKCGLLPVTVIEGNQVRSELRIVPQ